MYVLGVLLQDQKLVKVPSLCTLESSYNALLTTSSEP